jgi:hypothetical protein
LGLRSECSALNRPLFVAAVGKWQRPALSLFTFSVERGIGPVCRRKTGYDEPVDEAARERGNKLVHAIATQECTLLASVVQQYVDELEAIGFGRLVQAILDAESRRGGEKQGDAVTRAAPSGL